MLLAIAWFAPSQVSATSFNAFYAFGDSSIDSGWWVGALNGQCDGAAAPCATGSAGKNALIADGIANGGTGAPVGIGLMRSQDIAAHYGLTAIPANQPGGTNYAISGALSVAVAGDGNLNLNPNLPSAATQIANYLGAHANLANPSGLYVLSAGGKRHNLRRSKTSSLRRNGKRSWPIRLLHMRLQSRLCKSQAPKQL